MKSHEILSVLDAWRAKGPEELLASPAWAMPCRLGEEQVVMRAGAVRPVDPLILRVRFGATPHTLAIGASARFPELSRVWSARTQMPEAIILALVERECAPFLQLLENAMHQQMAIDGLGGDWEESAFCGEVGGIVFTLSRTPQLIAAFGRLAFIDADHESIRNSYCAAEYEFASFAMNPKEIENIATGDALVVPELDAPTKRIIVEGKIVVEADGASAPYADDTLCHIRTAAPVQLSLGALFDGTVNVPTPDTTPLKLVYANKTAATGRYGKLAEQAVVVVE
jgi:hypothetical protein